jgi:serine protease DegS
MRNFSFLGWPIVTGVLIAIILLQFFPNLLAPPVTTVEIKETQVPTAMTTTYAGNGPVSYADAVAKAAPAVVNIYSSKVVKTNEELSNNPLYRRFFENGDVPQRQRIRSSLGSGANISSRLVVGQASMKMKHRQIQPIVDMMSEAVKQRREV